MLAKYLVLFFVFVMVLSALSAAETFTLNFNSPSDPSITGLGWGSCKESCGNYCAVITPYNYGSGSSWESGYYFDSPFSGAATCTLTLKATGFTSGGSQNNEVVEAKVNGVVFSRTSDICNSGSCTCNIATRTSTKTVTLSSTNNYITARRPGHSVSIKSASLTCTSQSSCTDECTDGSRTCYDSDTYQICGDYDSDSCTEWGYYNCPSGETCDGGSCESSCTDECTDGERVCYDSDTYQICGDYDSDSCTEWGYYNCQSGDVCDGGYCDDSCTDECTDGERVCYDSDTYQICGDYDSDSCTEWGYYNCPSGDVCDGGYCDDSCTDECTDGERVCYDSDTYRICGDYDSDSCTEWGYYNCQSGDVCNSGYCDDECTDGYLDDYQCNGYWLQRLYQYSDCSTQWLNYDYCSYGCSGDACEPGPDPYCIDTDGGIVYDDQGNTYGVGDDFVAYSYSDYCDGDTLYEYYCVGNNWALTSNECDDNCENGACVPDDCEDECTYGDRVCDGDDEYRRCGYYDSDVCLDWETFDCDDDEVCDDGYCEDDDCDPGFEDDYRCSGNWRQRRYIDSSCDDEWIDWEYCSSGCVNDQCYGCGTPSCGYCGNNICEAGETECSCPQDCSGNNQCGDYCGDGYCDSGEDPCSCPQDCTGYNPCNTDYCGDGYCDSGEDPCSCPQDCTGYNQCNNDYCGDGSCNNGESCSTCSIDCGQCNYCGDGICNNGETQYTCSIDCGTPEYCGDGICNNGETQYTCSIDCGTPQYCGDGICNNGETQDTCSIDCGTPDYCGDGYCNSGESCSTCQQDCGVCDVCGDGFCTGSESCLSCTTDCGECQNPCDILIGDNVIVTAEACLEFEGTGSDVFNLTIYSRENNDAIYGIALSGEAAPWSTVVPNSLLVPALDNRSALISVTIPSGIPQGLYNVTAEVSSGGQIVAEKLLYVSVVDEDTGDDQTVVITDEPVTPTGEALFGELDMLWIGIILILVIILILGVVLIKELVSRGT